MVFRAVSLVSLGLLAASGSLALPAAAQNNTAHKATAEAYFDDALRLMQSSNFAEACPKLEASQRLDPAVGTLLYLGECYERRGRTASAWVTFREAEALARATAQPQRAEVAKARVERLQPGLSRVTVELSSEARAIPGLRVSCGTVPLDPALPAVALPVDPGEILVEASAQGYAPFSRTVVVPAAGQLTVSIPALVRQATVEAAHPPLGSNTVPVARAPEASSGPVLSARRGAEPAKSSLVWPIALGAVGVVGVGVGSFFGVRALNRASDANDLCPDGRCREERGVSLMDSARSSATISNVAFAVGAAALVGGVVFYLVDRPKHEGPELGMTTWFGPERAGVSLGGSL